MLVLESPSRVSAPLHATPGREPMKWSVYEEFLNEAPFFLLPKQNSEVVYIPSSPWQTSVRVAPPIIN